MTPILRRALRSAAALATVAVTGLASTTSAEPFYAFLAPDTSFVDAGSSFTVQFRAGDPAAHFNGYEVRIRFDPALVAFQSVAEGSLMVAGAPSRFAVPQATDSTVSYTHVLLGAGMFVSGPGELSRFTFQALVDGISALDIVSDPHCTFYDDGLCVNDDTTQVRPRTVTLEGAVVVTGGLPVDAPALGGVGSGLRFLPNPAREAGEFQFDIRRRGAARLAIVDVAGRLVKEWQWVADAGTARRRWGGVDAAGTPLSAGVYFARLEDQEGARNLRIVLLR